MFTFLHLLFFFYSVSLLSFRNVFVSNKLKKNNNNNKLHSLTTCTTVGSNIYSINFLEGGSCFLEN